MKTIILLAMLMTMIVMPAYTQYLEHFTVDTTDYFWKVRPIFDSRPQSGVNGLVGGATPSIAQLISAATKTLPEDIKKEIIKYKIVVYIYLNSKGEIFYLYFKLDKGDRFSFNDKQLLKMYNTFRHLKIDLSTVDLMDNFEWGAGFYPLHRYLQSK